jgi:hypothetical protein
MSNHGIQKVARQGGDCQPERHLPSKFLPAQADDHHLGKPWDFQCKQEFLHLYLFFQILQWTCNITIHDHEATPEILHIPIQENENKSLIHLSKDLLH